jgi:hypothetical protein
MVPDNLFGVDLLGEGKLSQVVVTASSFVESKFQVPFCEAYDGSRVLL